MSEEERKLVLAQWSHLISREAVSSLSEKQPSAPSAAEEWGWSTGVARLLMALIAGAGTEDGNPGEKRRC